MRWDLGEPKKSTWWKCAAWLVLLLPAALCGCGGQSSPPISVTVSAMAQTVDEGRTVTLSAGVANDPSNAGVTWKASCSASACGSVSTVGVVSAVFTAPTPVTAALAVTVTATSRTDPTKSASISVTVAAPPAVTTTSLPGATDGVSYSAVLQESGGLGPFTWSLDPATSLPGGLSLASNGTISGIPADPGTINFAVQVADSGNPPLTATANLSISVAVPPISITTTSLPNATLDAIYSQPIQATGGIPPYTWSVVSGSLPPWAVLNSSTGVVKGIPGAAGMSNFTVQVADSEATSLTSTQALSITAEEASSPNDAELNGRYAFLFNGFDDATGSQIAVAGSFVADGKGKITSGIEDRNGPTGSALGESLTGTYSVDSDNRGGLTITTASGSRTYALVLNSFNSGVAQKARFIQFDDTAGTNGQRGSGLIRLQDNTSFSLNKINGGYAFGFAGQDAIGNREAIVGSFNAGGAGTISSGVADQNIAGTATNPSLTGTYAAPSASEGRMTLHLTPAGASALDLSAYMVSASEFLAVGTNSFSSQGLVSGQILSQTSASFDKGALNSTCVYYENGVDAGTITPQSLAEIGLLSPNGSGNLSITYDNQVGNSTISKDQTFAATYSIVASGRVTVTGWYGDSASPSRILYLVDKNKAFFLDASPGVGFGFVEAQSQPSGGFSEVSFSGSLSAATISPSLSLTRNTVGLATPDGSGNFTETDSFSSSSGLVVDETTSGPYTVDSTGRVIVNQIQVTDASLAGAALALAAGMILFGLRKPTSSKPRRGFALFSFAVFLTVTPSSCPPPPPKTNQLVLYMISSQKAVMIHQKTGQTTPAVEIIEQ